MPLLDQTAPAASFEILGLSHVAKCCHSDKKMHLQISFFAHHRLLMTTLDPSRGKIESHGEKHSCMMKFVSIVNECFIRNTSRLEKLVILPI